MDPTPAGTEPIKAPGLMKLLLEAGVTTFLELGPGKVLAGIASRMAKEAGVEIKALSIGAPEDLAAL